jgi:hypothetical protein
MLAALLNEIEVKAERSGVTYVDHLRLLLLDWVVIGESS